MEDIPTFEFSVLQQFPTIPGFTFDDPLLPYEVMNALLVKIWLADALLATALLALFSGKKFSNDLYGRINAAVVSSFEELLLAAIAHMGLWKPGSLVRFYRRVGIQCGIKSPYNRFLVGCMLEARRRGRRTASNRITTLAEYADVLVESYDKTSAQVSPTTHDGDSTGQGRMIQADGVSSLPTPGEAEVNWGSQFTTVFRDSPRLCCQNIRDLITQMSSSIRMKKRKLARVDNLLGKLRGHKSKM